MEENNVVNVSEKPKKKFYKKWWFWVLIVVVVAIIGSRAAGGDDTPKTDGGSQGTQGGQVQTEKPAQKEDLEVSDLKMTTDELSTKITGKLTNNTDKTYSYVHVTFSLYDSEGALLGTALANVGNLESGGVWKFEAVSFEKNVASYKLTEIVKY